MARSGEERADARAEMEGQVAEEQVGIITYDSETDKLKIEVKASVLLKKFKPQLIKMLLGGG